MCSLSGSWDSLCTSPTQQTKRTECSVLGTPSTPEPRYLILPTSAVFITGDTSFTTTTELILRILKGILVLPTLNYVNWKCTVRRTQIQRLCKQQEKTPHVKHRKSIELKYEKK